MPLTLLFSVLLAVTPPHVKPIPPHEKVSIHLPVSQAITRVVIINGYYYYEWKDEGKIMHTPVYDNQGRMLRAEKQNNFNLKPVYIK